MLNAGPTNSNSLCLRAGARVVVKFDLPAADAANDPPAIFRRELAKLIIRHRPDKAKLSGVRDENLGFDREPGRNLLDQWLQVLFHPSVDLMRAHGRWSGTLPPPFHGKWRRWL